MRRPSEFCGLHFWTQQARNAQKQGSARRLFQVAAQPQPDQREGTKRATKRSTGDAQALLSKEAI